MKKTIPLKIKPIIIQNIEEMEENSSLFVVHPDTPKTNESQTARKMAECSHMPEKLILYQEYLLL